MRRQFCPNWLWRIGGRDSHQHSCDGTGDETVAVAVLDSGIYHHSELNVVSDVSFPGADPATGCLPTDPNVDDVFGHGTRVAGVIGMRDDTDDGAVGVASGAPLSNVRVASDTRTSSPAALICGLNWAVDNGYLIGNISISFSNRPEDGSCATSTDALHQAICSAVNTHGVSVVASAGNASTDFAETIPPRYDEVITATSMNAVDYRWLGPPPDYAPSTTDTTYFACNVAGGRDDCYSDF
jgi:subtilisin